MPRKLSTCILVAMIAIALLLSVTPARAADPIAESMFQQALQMMREGKFEEARKSLEASHKLEPKSGTMLVLGSCNEQLGRTATAWAQYKEAAGLARVEGRTEHTAKATELAKALEPRLSKLRIDAQRMQGGVQLTVKLDGGVVLDGALGVSFAIDPGEHLVAASAPGRNDWSSTIRVGVGEAQIVAVPELERMAPSVVPPPQSPPIMPPAQPAEPVDAKRTRIWPWVVGGVGVALGGVAIGFGVDQQMAASELDDQCGERRAACPSGDHFEADRDREVRDFGLFLGLGLGGVAAVTTGVVGLVLPVDSDATAARVELGPGTVSVVGQF